MELLARSLEDERQALGLPWKGLEKHVHPLPGDLVIAAGAPGVAKSLVALLWPMWLQEPVRIVSMDTSSRTQAARVVAALTGKPTAHALRERAWAADVLRKAHLPISFYDQSVSVEDVDEMIQADKVWFGQTPVLVVVDDVRKLRKDADGEYEAFEHAFFELHQLARKHDTVVLALHHINRKREGHGVQPVNLDDLKYGGDFEAEIVLGLWRPVRDRLRIGVLKNRSGEDDPAGGLFVELKVDFEHAKIEEIEAPVPPPAWTPPAPPPEPVKLFGYTVD